MMRMETWGRVGLFGVLVLLAGCDPRWSEGALGADGAAWCREACNPGGVLVATRGRCECAHPEACSIDRLLVTPVPPGRKVAAREVAR